jgi:hypothetical protein
MRLRLYQESVTCHLSDPGGQLSPKAHALNHGSHHRSGGCLAARMGERLRGIYHHGLAAVEEVRQGEGWREQLSLGDAIGRPQPSL